MDPADILRSKHAAKIETAAEQSQKKESTEEEEEDDEIEELGPLPDFSEKPQGHKRREPYTPLSAESYFSQALEVELSGIGTFRAYYTPPVADKDEETGDIVLVTHHGAGFGALSFACFARDVTERSGGRLGILAFDARGHGATKLHDENSIDYSLQTLSNDLVSLLKQLFPSQSEAPQFLLLGHSMGGAVVTEACPLIQNQVGKVLGVCLLDIVEGSAIEALPTMMSIINQRPSFFPSLEDAIAWHFHSGTIKNLHSARISVPSLVKRHDKLSTEQEASSLSSSSAVKPQDYLWRTDLSKTEQFWENWYSSLSSKFLSVKAAKLLVLAGTDRLDKNLTIGQMQGKYQLVVMQEVGHCIHEDAPDRLSETIVEFWKRNDQADILKNVKKVGQI